MGINFYEHLKNEMNHIIRNCSEDNDYSISFYSDFSPELRTIINNNYFKYASDLTNFFSCTVVNHKNLEFMYVKIDAGSNVVFLRDGKNIVKVNTNFVDKTEEDLDITREQCSSNVYLNGNLKNIVISNYTKTEMGNELLYEKNIAFTGNSKYRADITEISYFLGEPFNCKRNGFLLDSSNTDFCVNMCNLSLDYVFNFFDKFNLSKVKTKKL